jgi:hypothetical protein
MSAERDVSRIVRSWLFEDEHDSADRVLQDVLVLLDTTPQRRPSWPAWRYGRMQGYGKLAIAAAAAVVVAAGVVLLLPGSSPDKSGASTGPTTVPTVAQSPAGSPAPSPTAAPLAFPRPGPLAIGRHAMTRSGIQMSVEVTADGWGSLSGGVKFTKNLQDAAFIFWVDAPDGVYVDPCAQVKGPTSTDPAVLAAAVADLPDTELVAGPTDVIVGGEPAKEIEIRIASEPACPTALYLWYEEEIGGRWASANGDTMIVWIIDVEGTLVWIDAEIRDDAPPELEEELRAMVDSIEFVLP